MAAIGIRPEAVREFHGRRVVIELTEAAGGGQVAGLVTGLLESDDGLVVYLDTGGERRGVHYHHIAEISEAKPA